MKTCRRIYHFLRSETGSVAIEFAIILFPLLLFVIGSIETARFFWTNNAVEEIASSTSRCMALRAPECSVDGGETVDLNLARERIKEEAAFKGIRLPDTAITLEVNALCSGVSGFSLVEINDRFSTVFSLYLEIPIQVSACFPNQVR